MTVTHYTQLPANSIGIQMRGSRQRDRAEELVAYDDMTFYTFTFWLPLKENATVGSWVISGVGKPAFLKEKDSK